MGPKLEFISTVWNPYLQKDIHTIEMVQRHATLFVTKMYDHYSSVTTILSQLHWENLQDRRSKACVILVYKIINGLVCIQPEPYFATPTPGNINLQRSRPLHYISTRFARTDYLKFSFFYKSIVLWNSLPKEILNGNPDRYKDKITIY